LRHVYFMNGVGILVIALVVEQGGRWVGFVGAFGQPAGCWFVCLAWDCYLCFAVSADCCSVDSGCAFFVLVVFCSFSLGCSAVRLACGLCFVVCCCCSKCF
jgi:hypothetical protein